MISDFSKIYSVSRPFKESYSGNIAFTCFFIGFYSFGVKGNIFFFSKFIIFIACSFKDLQNYFVVQRMLILYVVKSTDC